MTNRQWLIADRPIGRALRGEDFRWAEGAVPDLKDGDVLVRTLVISFDPGQKGWMENISTYVAPTQIGDVMRASGVGRVVESRSPLLQPGDVVRGMLCWQDYAALPARELERLEDDDLLTANLGVLGGTGMTAYFGLRNIGRPFPGDTVVISGAAGSTGSTVAQLARIGGCRVVGIAGGPEKVRWLTEELGVDAAADYKAGDLRGQLAALLPNGADVVWDNVGGTILNDMLAHLAMGARVVACGGISRHATGSLPVGPENYFNLIFKRATMSGFIVWDNAAEYPAARARMKTWIRDGRVRYVEDVQHGLENAPRTLMRLYEGRNLGKQLLRVADQ